MRSVPDESKAKRIRVASCPREYKSKSERPWAGKPQAWCYKMLKEQQSQEQVVWLYTSKKSVE